MLPPTDARREAARAMGSAKNPRKGWGSLSPDERRERGRMAAAKRWHGRYQVDYWRGPEWTNEKGGWAFVATVEADSAATAKAIAAAMDGGMYAEYRLRARREPRHGL